MEQPRDKSRDSRGDLWGGHHVRGDLLGDHHLVGRPPHESQPVARPVGRPARPVEPADERHQGQRHSRRRPSPPARSFEEEDSMF